MVRAAARTGLDFKHSDHRARFWWLKVRWIINQLEDDDVLSLFRMQHNQHCSVLSYQTPEAFKQHWDEANKLLDKIYSLLIPWDKKASKKRGNDYSDLIEQWKHVYGDLKDPKVKAHFDDVAKSLRKHREDGKRKYQEGIQKKAAQRAEAQRKYEELRKRKK